MPNTSPPFGQADLSNCERELIHLAGSVQPHGVLLALDAAKRSVQLASANLPTLFGGAGVEALLGLPLARLDASLDAAVAAALPDDGETEPVPLACTLRAGTPHARPVEALLHRAPGASHTLLLELEPLDASLAPVAPLAASPRPDGMLPMAAAGDIERHDTCFIPDWALHWVRALHNLWRHTGDRDAVARLLPVAEGVLRWFEPFCGADGLVAHVTGWVIVDWSSVSVEGCSSVLNALWARGLRDFSEICDWTGDAGRARWARDRHETVSNAFERFWDPERLLYVDRTVDGERRPETSQHAQATAIVAGLAPAERFARLVEAMTDEASLVHATWSRAHADARTPREGERGVAGPYLALGPPAPWWDVRRQMVRAQPFYRYVVHDAVCAAGREDLIASLCLDWTALLERCETSLSETWYGGTTCHGWSATPTRDLSTRTLGVTPAEPGFGVARVAPRLGPLAWARGAVPTPAGLLRVDVTRERVEIESPVPVVLDLGGARRLAPGSHRIVRE